MRSNIVALLLAAAPLYPSVAAAPPPPAQPATNGWGIPGTDVLPDPAVRFGRLPNGMKYAIRANGTPEGTASIHLHFDFGSLIESDRERGLAHFIEHMAFNGTTHVPEGEMKKRLERLGLAFGPDTNAFTNFDSTRYVLELPRTDDQRVDTALFLLRETASEVTFDPAAVDRERGVILSEKRSRENFQLRRTLAGMSFGLPQSTLPNRIPIGTDQVLNKATAQQIADLYRRYYRPENATLVFVGDVDPAAIEAKIRQTFGDWTGKGPAGFEPDRGRVDFQRGADFGSFADPAVQTSASISVLRPWDNPPDTQAERRRKIIQSLGNAMLNRRLQQIANAPGAQIIAGGASQSSVKDLVLKSEIGANAPDGKWQAALTTVEQELRRALQFGFNSSELAVQLADTQGAMRMAADQADTRSNQSHAAAILSVIDDQDFITTPQFRLDFFNRIKPTITPAEVNAEFRRTWAGSAPLIFVSDKQPVAKAEIAAVIDGSRKVAVLPPKDNGRLRFAYQSFGKPGTIASDSRIADLGIRTVRFANNVRLNIKRTDFEKGALRYSIRIAGGELALGRDKVGLPLLINSTSSLAALEKHSAEDLKQIMAGHGVRSGLSVTSDAIVAQGRTIPGDLVLQMKLTAAFVTSPGYRPEAAMRWASVVPIVNRQSTATAQVAFATKAQSILANDDARFGLPPAEVLSSRTLGEAKAALQPLLATAPIEIGIVGDVNELEAIAAVATTFGALPTRQLDPPSYADARKVQFRSTPALVTLRHGGQADQAVVGTGFPTDDNKDSRRTLGLELLEGVLKQSLEQEIRETLGATYGVTVNNMASDTYDGFGYVLISAVVAPDRIPAVEKAIASVVADVIAKPVSIDLLDRVRNPILERIDRGQRDNGYWIGLVDEAQTDAHQLDLHRHSRDLFKAVTPAEIRDLARRYLQPAKAVNIRVLPQSEKLASSTP